MSFKHNQRALLFFPNFLANLNLKIAAHLLEHATYNMQHAWHRSLMVSPFLLGSNELREASPGRTSKVLGPLVPPPFPT